MLVIVTADFFFFFFLLTVDNILHLFKYSSATSSSFKLFFSQFRCFLRDFTPLVSQVPKAFLMILCDLYRLWVRFLEAKLQTSLLGRILETVTIAIWVDVGVY